MRTFIFLVYLVFFFAFFTEARADYTVECSGTNDETGDSISGECEDGSFSGTDDNTGNSVSGSCEFEGDLDANDDSTGQHVSGDCEGE